MNKGRRPSPIHRHHEFDRDRDKNEKEMYYTGRPFQFRDPTIREEKLHSSKQRQEMKKKGEQRKKQERIDAL